MSPGDYENFSRIEKLIESFLRKNPFKHHLVLSLGCGTAQDLAKTRELYPLSELFGIDTSRNALLRAKNRLFDTNKGK